MLPRTNKVTAKWTAVAGVTYSLTFTYNGSTVDVPVATPSKAYGPGADGEVAITLTATQNGLQSTATYTAYLTPFDICNPLQGHRWLQGMPNCQTCGNTRYTCQIPLRGDAGWLKPSTEATANSVQNPLSRYGSAAGLLVLAGLINLGRRRGRGRHTVDAVGATPPTLDREKS